MTMKLFGTALATLFFATEAGRAAISLGIGAVPGSQLQFSAGSSFNFNNSASGGFTGDQWWIINGGNGTSAGFFGWFRGGPWTYGSITVQGDKQSAPITGSTASTYLTIYDSSSQQLTADFNWGTISTQPSGNGLNGDLLINVSNVQYAGSNSDLRNLAAGGLATLVVSFTTSSTLSDLSQGSVPPLAFSGSITAVPEPAAFAGLAAVCSLLVLVPAQRIWSGIISKGWKNSKSLKI
jgi:hypothetical protein